jgi:hypothetical protein
MIGRCGFVVAVCDRRDESWESVKSRCDIGWSLFVDPYAMNMWEKCVVDLLRELHQCVANLMSCRVLNAV